MVAPSEGQKVHLMASPRNAESCSLLPATWYSENLCAVAAETEKYTKATSASVFAAA